MKPVFHLISTFCFLLSIFSSAALAQTKSVIKTISTNAVTENLVVPTGKSITINSGASIINNGTATGFGGGGGTPGGSTTQIQYNNAGAFGGISGATTDGTTLSVTSPAVTTSLTTPSTSFDLLNTTATTINAFGAASTLNLGASGGIISTESNFYSTARIRTSNDIYTTGTGYLLSASTIKLSAGAGLVTTLSHAPTDNRAIAFPDASGTILLTDGSGASLTALNATQLTSGTVPAARMPALTGDITTSAGAVATTLATVNSNVGSFTNASVTVNAKGLVTAASSGTAPVTSISGTANEITVTGTTTPTLSIPSAVTFTGKTITGGTFASPTLTTPDIGVATGTSVALTNSSNAANTIINASNLTSGTAAIATIAATANGGAITLQAFSSAYTTSSSAIAGYGRIRTGSGLSGLSLVTGTTAPIVFSPNDTERMRLSSAGGLSIGTTTEASAGNLLVNGTITTSSSLNLPKTITAAATTGAQTINKPSGSVNFAAAATSLVVTNSLVTTSSVIICTIATNDATAADLRVVAGSGSFTINLGTAPTAETRVNFIITN